MGQRGRIRFRRNDYRTLTAFSHMLFLIRGINMLKGKIAPIRMSNRSNASGSSNCINNLLRGFSRFKRTQTLEIRRQLLLCPLIQLQLFRKRNIFDYPQMFHPRRNLRYTFRERLCMVPSAGLRLRKNHNGKVSQTQLLLRPQHRMPHLQMIWKRYFTDKTGPT